jgi:hydroxylamine dehydrogenase
MSNSNGILRSARVLILGLVAVVIVFGVALILMAIARSGSPAEEERVNVLVNSKDACVVCHATTSPGIVEQFGRSTMARAEVNCVDCHEVTADYPGAVEHEGAYILGAPTTSMCEKCHTAEVAQFYQSRHSLPAYVAVAGSQELSEEQLAFYQSIPEGQYSLSKARNAIAELEGPDMTPFTCFNCHNIGVPAIDGSVGQCQKCHLRHEYSLEQARKPETCNACHIGPDHPQWEIYQESPHGIAYSTMGHNWEWEAEAGSLSVTDFPAATCSICHMSGFGTVGTTHDVGDRLTWYLFSPISERRPGWQDNMVRMQGVCFKCHNTKFITDFYAAADKATERVNVWVRESDEIMEPLITQNLLTPEQFDEPVDYIYFELWHHWGRTAKFGTWMQGPDYAQWHGAYEVLADLAELREIVADTLHETATEP